MSFLANKKTLLTDVIDWNSNIKKIDVQKNASLQIPKVVSTNFTKRDVFLYLQEISGGFSNCSAEIYFMHYYIFAYMQIKMHDGLVMSVHLGREGKGVYPEPSPPPPPYMVINPTDFFASISRDLRLAIFLTPTFF